MPRSASRPSHRADQLLQLGNEARVEGAGQRAARRIELRGQLVAAGHRQVGQLADQLAHRDLMRRIAHREIAADGEGRDLRRMVRDRRPHRREVERPLLVAGRLVAAGDEDDRIAAQRLAQAGAIQRLGVVAQQDAGRSGAPWPSTMALVARVVEIETMRDLRRRGTAAARRAWRPPGRSTGRAWW